MPEPGNPIPVVNNTPTVEEEQQQNSITNDKKSLLDEAKQWQTDDYRKHILEETIRDSILSKIEEMTNLMKTEINLQKPNSDERIDKTTTSTTTNNNNINNLTELNNKNLNWNDITKISAKFIDEYAKNVDSILKKISDLYRVCIYSLLLIPSLFFYY